MTAARHTIRPAPRPAPEAPARALGLTGESPFRPAMQQAQRRARDAADQLGSRFATLRRLPYHQQAAAVHQVIVQSGATRQAVARNRRGEHVSPFDVLMESSNARDRQQLAAFAHESAQKINASWVHVNQTRTVPRSRIEPARPGTFPSGLVNFAMVDLPRAVLKHDFRQPLAQIGAVGGAVGRLAKPVASDAASLVVNTPQSLYAIGDAGVQAAQGNLGPAKRIGEGLADGAIGHLVRGDVRGAAKYAGEHPLFAALEFSGAEGALGRTAGAVMRSGALGAGARAAAATARAPILDTYGRTLAERSYSKDVLRKGAQVVADRVRLRDGVPRSTARQVHLSSAAVDEFASTQEGLRRVGRHEAGKRMLAAVPTRGSNAITRTADRLAPARARPERDILQAVVESRVSPHNLEADLHAERARLEKVYQRSRLDRSDPKRVEMSADERGANRKQVRAIGRVLRSPAALANTEGIARASRSYKAAANLTERKRIALGLVEEQQALASKLRPYAVAKMGARFDARLSAPEHMVERHEHAVSVEQAAGAKVAAARQAEREAQMAHGAARRQLATARAQAGVSQGRAEVIAPRVDTAVGRQVAQAEARGELWSTRATVARARGDADAAAHAIANARAARTLVEELGRGRRVPALERLERARGAQVEAEQLVRRTRSTVADARRERRSAEQALRAAARQRQRVNPKHYVTGLVGADGKRLGTDEILAHMRDHDVEMPAFVSHRPNVGGSRAYLVNWFRGRPTVDGKARTGRATELGAHVSDFRSLAEHHIRSQGVVDATEAVDHFVHQFGLKHPSGRMYTWEEAERLADDPTPIAGMDSHGNRIPGHPRLVPFRAVPGRYSPETREAIADIQSATHMPDVEHLVEERLREGRSEPATALERKSPNVVLVPENELKRFAEHQERYSNTGAKLAQAATNAFRSTVLPFSTKWFFGNTVEAALRLTLVGATPRDAFIGRRMVKALEAHDAAAARQFRARTLGGLMYGGSERLAIHRTAETFKGTRLETPAAIAGALRRVPVVKQTADGIRLLSHGVFALNKMVEHSSQLAAIGKEARRRMQETTGSWLTATHAAGPAFDDLIHGLTETPAQVRYARAIDQTLGKYSRFSPTERKLFQTMAPFAPWYLNSFRFVFWTLPAHHPIKQALLANVTSTFEKDFQAQHQDVPPGDLRAGLVNPDGSVLPIAHYTPFGAFTSKDVVGTFEQLAAPQIASAIDAMRGKAFTGADLRTAHGKAGTADRIFIALNALAESMIPGMSVARRLREGGYSSFDNSTIIAPKIRPGTKHGSALDRVFNPLHPVYLGNSNGGLPAVSIPKVDVPTVDVPDVVVK